MSTSAISFCGNIYPRPCSHNVRRWIHSQTAGSGAPWATRAFCPLSPTHSCGNPLQTAFPAFKDRSAYSCGSSYCLSGFAEKDHDSQHAGFPQLFSFSTQAKVLIFAKPNLRPGERIWGKCLTCSPSPPPLLSGAPCPPTQDRLIRRALVLQTASWQPKLFQWAGCNTMPRGNGNSWQIPSPVFRYNVSSALRLS